MKSVTKNDIHRIAARALENNLEDSGAILYSCHQTIAPGEVYFLGLNPGGCGGPSLGEHLDNLLIQEDNAYLDEAWDNGTGSYEPGKAPLQKRVAWLLANIGVEPREVLSTNLIFMQSRDASGVSIEHAKMCWPVHEALLNIVRPRLILAYGNSGFSPYGYIHSLHGGSQRYGKSGHGGWSLKGFNAEIAGRGVFVAGVPHLSRYCPIGKQNVVEWIRTEGRDALGANQDEPRPMRGRSW